ncbi:hypothetical protein METHB2_490026 [Candidatus Methylobacter favarea]|uniref:Uncharacterized protein n=1 Tax=Candidatus Methylobacter favarea TaxID=2707345 RepID=A0A8S0XK09_9GAMM|nr:hypothetical protein METHB2_490026 [Candidatus Methylobacter favarea]
MLLLDLDNLYLSRGRRLFQTELYIRFTYNSQDWTGRDLHPNRYVYVWADGVYSHVRMDDLLCLLLVIIGSDESGRKELLALADGYRESAAS